MQDKVLMRKIKKREKQKLRLIQLKEAEKQAVQVKGMFLVLFGSVLGL